MLQLRLSSKVTFKCKMYKSHFMSQQLSQPYYFILFQQILHGLFQGISIIQTKFEVRLAYSIWNPLPSHLSDNEIGGAASSNFCRFQKPIIQQACPVYTVTGVEKVRGLALLFQSLPFHSSHKYFRAHNQVKHHECLSNATASESVHLNAHLNDFCILPFSDGRFFFFLPHPRVWPFRKQL